MGTFRNDLNFGYVPTSGMALGIADIFVRDSDGVIRVADVGCGKGDCLKAIQQQLAAEESYGIEIHPDRAKAAAQKLTLVLHEDVMQTVLDESVISLLYLNPPYQQAVRDDHEEALRVEHQWFSRFWRLTQKPKKTGEGGGIIVFVVSRRNLIWQSARLFARNFELLAAFDYPESEYDQVFVIGRRKFKPEDDYEVELFLNLIRAQKITASLKDFCGKNHIAATTLPELLERALHLSQPQGSIPVPCIMNPQPFRWLSEKPSMREVEARLASSPIWKTIDGLVDVPPLSQRIQTLMPPETGHLVPILEVSEPVLVRDKDGKNPLLVKMFGDRQTLRWEEETETRQETHVKAVPRSVLVGWTPQGELVGYQ